MQISHSNQAITNAHRRVKASTTLNRKYVKKPAKLSTEAVVPIKKSPKVRHFNSQQVVNKVKMVKGSRLASDVSIHPLQSVVNTKMQLRKEQAKPQVAQKLSAKELKDRAIQKALLDANQAPKSDEKVKHPRLHFGFPRIALALSCAAAAVFAIVYFVNLNMPDISLRVAAMQTGFDASYPGYVPRDYTLSSITSEEGKVVLNFYNQGAEASFLISEEKSAWDSNALLNNHVKDTYGENYSVIKEQGLTIYIDDSDAVWVNGGVLYTIKTTSGNLTKKQIKSIAVSL